MTERMPTVTASELQRKANEVLELAEDSPILITRYGKPTFVLMSMEHYERITQERTTQAL